MGKLAEKLARGERVLTAEVTPPKGAGIKKLIANAKLLEKRVDAVNVTDCQRALVKMSSLAACRVLLDQGIEPVFQLTCRDRNAIGLQADLMGATALGIPNLLALTGDPVKAGDHPESKSVFEVEAIRLLEIVGKLQAGTDWKGNKMNAPTKLFVGAAVNPTLQSLGTQFARMEKKIAAGARFFQTQANYDVDDFRGFLEKTRPLQTKVLAGIVILHSREIAEYIHENIPGIRFPAELLERYRKLPEGDEAAGEELGIEVAVELMLGVENVADGFHLMTIRNEELIPKVLDRYEQRIKTSAHAASPLSSPARG